MFVGGSSKLTVAPIFGTKFGFRTIVSNLGQLTEDCKSRASWGNELDGERRRERERQRQAFTGLPWDLTSSSQDTCRTDWLCHTANSQLDALPLCADAYILTAHTTPLTMFDSIAAVQGQSSCPCCEGEKRT